VGIFSALFAPVSTTALIVLGALVWLMWSFSDIKLVWEDPELELELDLVRDGLKGLGVFIVYALMGTVAWHMYIPNVIVYKAYLAAYYASYFAAGYGAASAFQVALSFGLWLVRKSDKSEN